MQTITLPLHEWQAMQAKVKEGEERQRELLDALQSMQSSSARTIAELQVGMAGCVRLCSSKIAMATGCHAQGRHIVLLCSLDARSHGDRAF